jgi:hypothetical protein
VRTVACLALVVLLAACSDAHTEEEKAWADDGIGPDIVTLFVPAAFELTARELAAAYEATDVTARVLVVGADDEQVAETLDDIDAPSVWLAPEATFSGLEPDDETVDVGATPLVIAYPRDGRPAPELEAFSVPQSGTGMCPTEATCGAKGRQLLANTGLTAAPDLVAEAPSLVQQLANGTLEMALVYAVDAKAAWLRVVDDHVATQDVELADRYAARSFGQAGRSSELLDWLETAPAARRVLARGGLVLPPAGPPVGS